MRPVLDDDHHHADVGDHDNNLDDPVTAVLGRCPIAEQPRVLPSALLNARATVQLLGRWATAVLPRS
jgi:hypothetical protein